MNKRLLAINFSVILAVCGVTLAQVPNAQGGAMALDGDWYNNAYRYGFRIDNNIGIATATNSREIKPGDVILKIQRNSPTTFVGQQLGANGRWREIKGTILPDGSLRIRDGSLTLSLVRVASQANTAGASKPGNTQSPRPPLPRNEREFSAVSEPYPSGAKFVFGGNCHRGEQQAFGLLPKNANPIAWPVRQEFTSLETINGPSAQIARDYAAFLQSLCPDLKPQDYHPVLQLSDRLPTRFPATGQDYPPIHVHIEFSRGSGAVTVISSIAGNAGAKKVQQAAQQAQQAASAEVERKKDEFLKRYGAIQLEKVAPLFRNPFAFEGKTVLLTVRFGEMTSPTSGIFQVLSALMDDGGLALVTDIPKNAFIDENNALIAARVLGKTKLPGAMPMDALNLKLIGFEKCEKNSCPF